MSAKKGKIPGTPDAWEDGSLGLDEASARKVDLSIEEVAEAVGLKTISIRMQPDLLEELKMIADFHGIGYQPLMKQVLRRFVDAEAKKIMRELHAKLEKQSKDDPQATMQDCA